MNEAVRLARLEAIVARLQAEMALKDQGIIEQIARIAELERPLEEVRAGGKRQAAPFSEWGIRPAASTAKSGAGTGPGEERPPKAGSPASSAPPPNTASTPSATSPTEPAAPTPDSP